MYLRLGTSTSGRPGRLRVRGYGRAGSKEYRAASSGLSRNDGNVSAGDRRTEKDALAEIAKDPSWRRHGGHPADARGGRLVSDRPAIWDYPTRRRRTIAPELGGPAIPKY